MMVTGKRSKAIIAIILAAVILLGLVAIERRTRSYVASTDVIIAPKSDIYTVPEKSGYALSVAEERLGEATFARDVAISAGLDHSAAFLSSKDEQWTDLLRLKSSLAAGESTRSLALAIEKLRRGLTISRVSDSYVLTIGYAADDPDIAAEVANRYASHLSEIFGSDDAFSSSTYRIISIAVPPAKPEGAPTWLIAILWLATAGAAGSMLLRALGRRESGFDSSADVQARLGLPVLASIPLLQSVLPSALVPSNAVLDSPQSGFAEAFRGILASVSPPSSRPGYALAIVSAMSGEGKSTIAACLARSASRDGARIVVIDGGSSDAEVCRLLVGDIGYTDPGGSIESDDEIRSRFLYDTDTNASILRLVKSDVQDCQDEKRLIDLMTHLKEQFEYIIVDVCATLNSPLPVKLLDVVDGAIFVTRWRSTPITLSELAIASLRSHGTRVVGAILNGVDVSAPSKMRRGDPNIYYQQSSQYYS